jgi:hypothetical protein
VGTAEGDAAEAEDVDGAAAATPAPASTAAADAVPTTPTIQAVLFLGESRRVRGRRPSVDADSGPDAAEECRVES